MQCRTTQPASSYVSTEPLSMRLSSSNRVSKTYRGKKSCCGNAVLLRRVCQLIEGLEGRLGERISKLEAAVELFTRKLDVGVEDV